MRALSLALLVASAFLLAGCSGSGAQEATGPTLPPVTIDPGSSTGAIRGFVLDEAIRTIANATVSVAGSGLSTQTDDDGVFVFEDLAPGTYFLTASKVRYLASQTSADVVAGMVADASIQLRADFSVTPYHVTIPFRGFIELWFGYAQFYTEQVIPVCECYLPVTPDANLTGMVFEAIWEDTTPRPTGLEDDQWYYDTFYSGGDGGRLGAGYCTSPCRAEIPTGDWDGGEILVMLQGPDFWVTFEQSFDMYVTLFYNGPIPEGWSFVNGDA